MNFTPLVKSIFIKSAQQTESWGERTEEMQRKMLLRLLRAAKGSAIAQRYDFDSITKATNPYRLFRERLSPTEYEDIRCDVMRMIRGESDLLWPGRCRSFAQSSGTSGGRSKFIPITERSLQRCHYAGSANAVKFHLRNYPQSRIFAGKAMILGGSFANELDLPQKDICVGDLSATLINRINPIVNLFRIPDRHTALLPDWQEKLPRLVEAGLRADVTNISGVPSWFLTVIKEMLKKAGADSLHDIWPNLEVFFHGGISFEPYRAEYEAITDPLKMHFLETYNASEGFFAVQNDPADSAMLLLLDNDIFYEFIPIDEPDSNPIPLWEVEAGKVYEMLITSSNGLWRYRIGDTLRIDSVNPVKIRIAGRTKCFINAFGEELMQENAERAVADVCKSENASMANYTVAPKFAEGNNRGRHQWYVEWEKAPADIDSFAVKLDNRLRELNSDYDAKRAGTIFLDPLEIITLPQGCFDRWLSQAGNGKLGGQRKIPRLSNDRKIAEEIEALMQS